MRQKRIISIASALFAAALGVSVATPVFAQERDILSSQNRESADDKITRKLAEARAKGEGFILIDALMPGHGCGPLQIIVGRKVDGKIQHTRIGASWSAFGKTHFRGAKELQEGEYYVLALVCTNGNVTQNFNGPHAKFQVKTGEIVNVGMLKFDYKRDEGFFSTTGTARRTIGELRPTTIDGLKKNGRRPQAK